MFSSTSSYILPGHHHNGHDGGDHPNHLADSGGEILHTHHHFPMISSSFDHQMVLNGDHHYCQYYNAHNITSSSSSDHFLLLPGKKPVKKDRHSKIYTAQGLRDRRVRLSIQIARKFFDLQELLGFDKASKTLEWLLSKSKNAIEELSADSSDKGTASLSSSDIVTSSSPPCHEVLSSENGGAQIVEGMVLNWKPKGRSMKMSLGGVSEVKRFSSKASPKILMAKELRAKARERARERTRLKMSFKKCPSQSFQKLGSNYTQNISTSSLKFFAHHEVDHHHQESNLDYHHHPHSLAYPTKADMLEESIVIKRKMKPSSTNTIMGYHHQNLVMLKDVVTFNNNNKYHSSSCNYFPNSPPNFDNNNGISGSSFRAITNMNLPAGLQFCGKIWNWEAESNQSLQ